jgi:2-iminobutanoate/2-iminopropanoate deaminase
MTTRPTAVVRRDGLGVGRRRTTVTVLAVAPARAGALVEIEAVASIPRR